MSASHLIGELSFETRIDPACLDTAPWDDWPGLCRGDLAAAIDRVLDECGGAAGQVWQIDVLEVDLGELSGSLGAADVAARLADALRRQLGERLRADAPQAVRSVDLPAPFIPPAPTEPLAMPSSPVSSATAPLPACAWVEQALAVGWQGLEALLAPLLADPDQLARLLAAWPEDLLQRVAAQLRGGDFQRLHPYAEMLAAAGPEAGEAARQAKWRQLAAALFGSGAAPATAAFVCGCADALAGAAAGPQARLALCARLDAASGPAALAARHIRFWLLGAGPEPVAAADPACLPAGGGLHVDNAGLVLAAPYLPHLFGMLGLVRENRFVDAAAARRACHLLQFAAAAQDDAPEHGLALNKLLCGVDISAPLDAAIAIGDEERSTIESMLQMIIERWRALGHTSVAGLRETFLQRRGALAFRDAAWRLEVEAKTVDVLLERLPWGFSLIRHPWMAQPLMVEWR